MKLLFTHKDPTTTTATTTTNTNSSSNNNNNRKSQKAGVSYNLSASTTMIVYALAIIISSSMIASVNAGGGGGSACNGNGGACGGWGGETCCSWAYCSDEDPVFGGECENKVRRTLRAEASSSMGRHLLLTDDDRNQATWENQKDMCADTKYNLKLFVDNHIVLLAKAATDATDGTDIDGGGCNKSFVFHDDSNSDRTVGKRVDVIDLDAADESNERANVFNTHWDDGSSYDLGTYALSKLSNAFDNAKSANDYGWYDRFHNNCATFILSMVCKGLDYAVTPEVIEYVISSLSKSDKIAPLMVEDATSHSGGVAVDDNTNTEIVMRALINKYIAKFLD